MERLSQNLVELDEREISAVAMIEITKDTRELPQTPEAAMETLRDLQKGLHLGRPLSRPMPDVAPGVHELRVTGKTIAVRVFYFVKIDDEIVVFHQIRLMAGERDCRIVKSRWLMVGGKGLTADSSKVAFAFPRASGTMPHGV